MFGFFLVYFFLSQPFYLSIVWVCAHMCKCICVSVHVCHDVHVEVRGQFAGVSVFLSCMFWGSNLSFQDWRWASTPESSCWPWFLCDGPEVLGIHFGLPNHCFFTKSETVKILTLWYVPAIDTLPWDLELLTHHQFLTIMTLKDWVQFLVHIYVKSHWFAALQRYRTCSSSFELCSFYLVYQSWGQEKTVQLFPLDILEDFFNMLSMGLKIVTKL